MYHVLTRANSRLPIFEEHEDFAAFQRVLEEAVERYQMRLLSCAVIPARRDWHLVVWPRKNGELSRFVGWLTLTRTQRWHAHRHSVGEGHLYQGRFKSILVQSDEHLYKVCRYVERNPLRAGLVRKAENWRWTSLRRYVFGTADIGNQDEDILVIGTTAYDSNNAALLAIMSEWTSGNSYNTRVTNITNGTGLAAGSRLVGDGGATQTVFNDNDVDTLTGSQGQIGSSPTASPTTAGRSTSSPTKPPTSYGTTRISKLSTTTSVTDELVPSDYF